jgi:predicted nucleotidyltransferase/GNAT superfamily N-acetyltransferase
MPSTPESNDAGKSAKSAEAMIDAVSRWAAARDDVLGLALVGSHARGAARPDSDLDFALVCADPELYLGDTDWVSTFGEVTSTSREDYGKMQSVRVRYRNAPELELGIAGPDWTVTPPDEGTAEVLRAGCVILLDREGLLERVLQSARESERGHATLIVRKAMADDDATLSVLLAECAVGHPAQGATPSPAWVREVMFTDPSLCRVLLAERVGQPIGFAAWRPTYDYLFGVRGAEVVWLFVRPGHRGVGVAAALLAQVCADVLRDGGRFLWGSYGRAIVGKFYKRMVDTRPETAVGLPNASVVFLANLAGRTPRQIARALQARSGRSVA